MISWGRLLLLMFLLSAVVPLRAGTSPSGSWQFVRTRYRGHEAPRPNPNLILLLTFQNDGTSFLRWSRLDELGFCERRTRYSAQGGVLEQTVDWINPGNRADCAADSDMQMGRHTFTVYRMNDFQLETDFGLGDEILTYIWEHPDTK